MTDFMASSLTILLLLIGMFVVLGVMSLMLKRREITVKSPVDKEMLTRTAAHGLQDQIQNMQMDLMGTLLLATLIVSLPFSYFGMKAHILSNQFPWGLALCITLGLTFAAYKTWRQFSTLEKLRLGYTAEIATANELIGLQGKGYQVFHDIQADGFNIDHLAIGRNGVFTIETKGRHKRNRDSKVSSKGNGKNYQLLFKDGRLCFPSWVETKPIEQALRQANWVNQWLSKATGNPVTSTPVLVFPGWFVTSQSKPPFPILNHKQLVKVLPTAGNQELTQQQVDAIVYQVTQRCLSKKMLSK